MNYFNKVDSIPPLPVDIKQKLIDYADSFKFPSTGGLLEYPAFDFEIIQDNPEFQYLYDWIDDNIKYRCRVMALFVLKMPLSSPHSDLFTIGINNIDTLLNNPGWCLQYYLETGPYDSELIFYDYIKESIDFTKSDEEFYYYHVTNGLANNTLKEVERHVIEEDIWYNFRSYQPHRLTCEDKSKDECWNNPDFRRVFVRMVFEDERKSYDEL